MKNYFLDSSALIKRYVSEIGTAWIQEIADAQNGNSLFISCITRVEVFSAFARRQREGNLSASDLTLLAQAFRYHLATQYRLILLEDIVIQKAENLAMQYPLRAYDAVQLASAQYCQTIIAQTQQPCPDFIFLTADDRLLNIAQMVGMLSQNPNFYP